jgi:hypothetical protein
MDKQKKWESNNEERRGGDKGTNRVKGRKKEIIFTHLL